MVSSTDFQKQIQNVETLKENLYMLVGITQKKIGTFCRKHANEWVTKGTPTKQKSRLLEYFAVSEETVTAIAEKFDISTYIKAVFSNPLFVTAFLFLFFFTIAYIVTFIVYSSCGRQCISFFTCGLFFKRKGRKHEMKNQGSDINDKENDIYEKKDLENVSTHEITESNENETQENIDVKEDQKKKKELKLLILLGSGLILLIILFALSLHASVSVKRSQKAVYKTICQIMNTSEHILTGDCSNASNENQNNTNCFTVKEALNDGVHILQHFVKGVEVLESQNFLSKEKTTPLLDEANANTLKLKALLNNVTKNGDMLVNNYKHYLLLGQHLKTVINTVLEEIESKKKLTEDLISDANEKMIQIGDQIEKILNNDVQVILNKVNLTMNNLKVNIDKIGENSIVEQKIGYGFDSFVTGFNIALLPIYIIFIITCIFIFYLFKKNEQSYNKIVVKLAGIFSAYFGFITILILIFVLAFTVVSMLGSTACVVKKETPDTNADSLYTVFAKKIPVVGVCLKNENATFVDESFVKNIEEAMENFDYKEIMDNVDKFTESQKSTLETFEESHKKVENKLWLVQVDYSNKNTLFNSISNQPIKNALLITHIFKKNIREDLVLKGVDTFLNIANAILFPTKNGQLCYEDPSCENNLNKYNITKNSNVNDNTYRTIRNSSTFDRKEDIDNVLKLLIYKSQILNEKIFDVSDLDEKKTEKITIKEYIVPDFETEKNNSFINLYSHNLITEFKSPKAANMFKQIVNHFIEIKKTTIEKLQNYQKRLNCQVVMTEVNKVKNALCYNLIESVAYVTIIYFVVALFTFFLWLYFLCLWIHHKKQQLINDEEKEERAEKDNMSDKEES